LRGAEAIGGRAAIAIIALCNDTSIAVEAFN
jgi:hypothetical protein